MPLPSVAGSWQAKGSPPTLKYGYKDSRFTNGPCKVAVIKKGQLLKIVCLAKVQPIDYSLDEPNQAAVGVRFTSGGITYCAYFTAALKDSGTDPPNPGGKGQFLSKDSGAPVYCLTPPAPCP
jgi:hypothetical protein